MAHRTPDTLFEILGHLQQAHLLLEAFQARNYQNDLIDDAEGLTEDAITQLRGAIEEYREGRAA